LKLKKTASNRRSLYFIAFIFYANFSYLQIYPGSLFMSLRDEERRLREENNELKRAIHLLNEQKEKLKKDLDLYIEWLNILWPLAEPPYFPAIFLGFSNVEDPRKEIIEKKRIPVDFLKCWLMIRDGTEIIGSASLNFKDRLKPGQFVLINHDYNVVAVIPEGEEIKELREATIVDKIGDLILLKDSLRGTRVVVIGEKLQQTLSTTPLEVGDQVLVFADCVVGFLDRKKSITVKENIKKKKFIDIGGLDKEREEILEILGIGYDKEELEGEDFPRGVILYGPPGCGKDSLVTALANELAWHLQVINGPSITSKWVGETPRYLREAFTIALKEKEKTGKPSLIFVNEADALFPVRGVAENQYYKSDYTTQFNVLMDSIEDTTGVFVILATNRLDLIDSAVIRPGRFDSQIFIPRPNEEAARKILMIYLSRCRVGEDGRKEDWYERWADQITKEIFAKKESSYLFKAFWRAGGETKFYFKDFVSGALLENIVKRLRRIARKRCKKEGISFREKNYGVISADFEGLVSNTIKAIIPRDRKALIQWLLVEGYSEAIDFRGGIFKVEEN
jgi:ATP-dependent 26S proteasome regulatory subunit